MSYTRGIVIGETVIFRGQHATPVTFDDYGVGGTWHHEVARPWEEITAYESPEGIYATEAPSEDAIRRYVLYWDSMVCPYYDDYRLTDDPDILPNVAIVKFPYRELLLSEGILSLVPITRPYDYGQALWQAFNAWRETNPDRRNMLPALNSFQLQESILLGSMAIDLLKCSATGQYWSLGYSMSKRSQHSDDKLAFFDTSYPFEPKLDAFNSYYHPASPEFSGSLVVNLVDALPVPGPEVPLEVIFEFRLKRRAELLAFRAAMDDLYDKIIVSTDPARAVASALEKIESALADLHRVSDERWVSRTAESVRTYLALSDPKAAQISLAAMGALGANFIHLSPALGALAGLAANAALTFEQRRHVSPLNRLPAASRDFAYLYHAQHMSRRTSRKRSKRGS